jgi:hypothetical protein
MNSATLTITQGDTKTWSVSITNDGSPSVVNLTGRVYKAEIASIYTVGNVQNYGGKVGAFVITNINAAAGTYDLVLPSSVSASLPIIGTETTFAFDVQYTLAGNITTEWRGRLLVYKEITI